MRNPTSPRRVHRRATAGLVAIALLATGCASNEDADAGGVAGPTVEAHASQPVAEVAEPITITVADHVVTAPASVSGGLRRIDLVNEGDESHHVQFMLLNEGATIESFGAAAAAGDGSAFGLVTLVGGPGATPAGASSSAYVDLAPGDYVLACFLPDGEGVPHLAHGMVAPLTVTPADVEEQVTATATISAHDFGFDGSLEVVAGEVFALRNTGTEAHEATLVALAAGATARDVVDWLLAERKPGPPPFIEAGGVQGVYPGVETAFGVAPEPGAYAVLCFIPSPGDGVAHFAKGMYADLAVT